MSREAGVYLRISLDPSGTRLGVTRQHRDCLTKAKTLGWHIREVYEDNDVSASSTKPRPAYQRMLADLEAGTINAVIVWDLDRLTRRPIEIEHFIDLADRKQIALASVGGDVDLGTDNGRLFARIKGAVARAEIERKSARQRAANTQRAEAGKPHVGRRAYGYSPDGLTVLQDEAAHIRDAAARLIAGQSINAITRHLNDAGARSTAGNPWRTTELRRMLRNPRYAALRVHQDKVIGPGQWPAILDADTHATIRGILDDPTRRAPGRPQASLLTSIATCVCGQTVYATRSGARVRHYYCRTRRHVTRQADPVDDYVAVAVVALAAEHGPMLLEQHSPDPGRIAHLRDRETELRARLDGLAQAYAAGAIDDLQLRAGSKRARGELEVVSKELVSASRSSPLARIVQASDPSGEWEAMGLDLQRMLVQEVATVRLLPPGRGARVFRPETVEVKLAGD
jgi:DNA invertase Pin-like site-specific DNA recombinase